MDFDEERIGALLEGVGEVVNVDDVLLKCFDVGFREVTDDVGLGSQRRVGVLAKPLSDSLHGVVNEWTGTRPDGLASVGPVDDF